MTNRLIALTVFLDEPIRDDDAEPIIAAIRQIRGVADVSPVVADVQITWAKNKAIRELKELLWKVLE